MIRAYESHQLLLPQTDLFKSYNPIINNGLQTYREP